MAIAEALDIRSQRMIPYYGTYVGRELEDDAPYRKLYKESNRELEKRSRVSEFLSSIERELLAERQLEGLRNLLPGWDSYAADPPNAKAIELAKWVLMETMRERLGVTRIVPSAEGGIGICFVLSGRYAHIETSNEGELTLVMTAGKKPAQINEINNESELVEALHRIRQHTNI